MRARLVTGYIPLLGHPRNAETYGELGERLSGVPVRKKAFYQRIEDTWLAKFIRDYPVVLRHSDGDNPEKNTKAYHCVQHQKSQWLVQAANEYPDDDIFVWVDYGIFHQPGINNEAIVKFMESLDDKYIYAPGCWDKGVAITSTTPCWRFCGSVLAVPKKLVDQFHYECRTTAGRHIAATNNVEWEVNTWARVESQRPNRANALPWRWYKADHDVTQFTCAPNYPEE